ncbi:hypothetical protein ACLB90_18460 [Stenotrophomonas sp. LGBM10]|uniref:hypothetical protein n=1 Tax=Stenotrophomonas sp. LGBM10 TaxID=3390038 RepID=UPI00398A9610
MRKTPGGVIEAANWLADRRGKSMHPETLRAKLNGTEGESVAIEIAELLTVWMQQKASGSDYALECMRALAGQFGTAVDLVPPAPEGGWADEINTDMAVLAANSISSTHLAPQVSRIFGKSNSEAGTSSRREAAIADGSLADIHDVAAHGRAKSGDLQRRASVRGCRGSGRDSAKRPANRARPGRLVTQGRPNDCYVYAKDAGGADAVVQPMAGGLAPLGGPLRGRPDSFDCA